MLNAPVPLEYKHIIDTFVLRIRGLLAHAISNEAKAFYEHHGFIASPNQPFTLILSLKK